MNYSGVFSVIPTFFNPKTSHVDEDTIFKHIDKQYSMGIRKMVILGTTSETATLTMNEKLSIAKNVWTKYNQTMSIVIGIGGIITNDVIVEANHFMHYCHALMVSAPYYVKPSQEGIYQHFTTIFSSVDKEFIIYNIPSRCGVNIEPETIARIYYSSHNVKAIKEASGSIDQVIQIKKLCQISILSGDDGLTLPFMSVGASGVISVISNIFPKEMNLIVSTFENNQNIIAQELFIKLYPYIKMAFVESNPVPLKYMLYYLYNYSPFVRMPLSDLTIKNKELIDEKLSFVKKTIQQEN